MGKRGVVKKKGTEEKRGGTARAWSRPGSDQVETRRRLGGDWVDLGRREIGKRSPGDRGEDGRRRRELGGETMGGRRGGDNGEEGDGREKKKEEVSREEKRARGVAAEQVGEGRLATTTKKKKPHALGEFSHQGENGNLQCSAGPEWHG